MRFFDVSKAARFAGITPGKLHRLIEAGLVFPPEHLDTKPRKYTGGARRYYTDDELPLVVQLVKRAEIPVECRPGARPCPLTVSREAEGWYSISGAARYLVLPQITIRHFLDKRRLPRPTHLIHPYRYYSRAELDGFKGKELRDYYHKRGL